MRRVRKWAVTPQEWHNISDTLASSSSHYGYTRLVHHFSIENIFMEFGRQKFECLVIPCWHKFQSFYIIFFVCLCKKRKHTHNLFHLNTSSISILCKCVAHSARVNNTKWCDVKPEMRPFDARALAFAIIMNGKRVTTTATTTATTATTTTPMSIYGDSVYKC